MIESSSPWTIPGMSVEESRLHAPGAVKFHDYAMLYPHLSCSGRPSLMPMNTERWKTVDTTLSLEESPYTSNYWQATSLEV